MISGISKSVAEDLRAYRITEVQLVERSLIIDEVSEQVKVNKGCYKWGCFRSETYFVTAGARKWHSPL